MGIARRGGCAVNAPDPVVVGGLRQPDDTWELAVLSVRAGRRLRRRLLRYPDLTLFTEQISPVLAAERLRLGLVSDGQDGRPALRFEVSKSTFNPVWRTTEGDRTWYSRSGWPEYYVWHDLPSRPDRRVNLINISQLVVPGLPVFVDGASAVAEFVYEEPREQVGNDSNTRIIVTLPDTRGRFERVTFRSGEVRLSLRGRALSGCCVRAAWRFAGDSNWRRENIDLTGQRSVAILTGQVPPEMACFPLRRCRHDLGSSRVDGQPWRATNGHSVAR